MFKRLVARSVCLLLGTNVVLKNNKLASFYSKSQYRHMVLLLDIENTT